MAALGPMEQLQAAILPLQAGLCAATPAPAAPVFGLAVNTPGAVAVSDHLFAKQPAFQAAQTTAHYITDRLAHLPVKVTRLAHGVPVGGELDHLDDGTIAAAMASRRLSSSNPSSPSA